MLAEQGFSSNCGFDDIARLDDYAPTMMLLMGMWISLTKNPMKPMMAKPMAVATAIFWNSGNEQK